MILLSFLLLGALRFQLSTAKPSPLQEVLTERHYTIQEAEFKISSQISSDPLSYDIVLVKLADFDIKEKIILYSEKELMIGARYAAILELLPINQDPVLDKSVSKYHIRAYIKHQLQLVQNADNKLSIEQFRISIGRILDARLGKHSDIAKTLLISDRTAKHSYTERFSSSGLSHLFAVSGLHVWFIYYTVMLILNFLLPRRIAELLFLILILIFAALNQWAAPITRAVLMIYLFVFARWLSRPVSPAQVLSLCLFIITLIDSHQLYNAGLQMSFTAVAVIMIGTPKIQIWKTVHGYDLAVYQRLINSSVNYFILSLLVSLAITPITFAYWGSGTFNSVIGNVFGIPLIALLLPLSFLLLVIPSGNFIFSSLYSSFVWLKVTFEHWAEYCSELPFTLSRSLQDTWIYTLTVLILIVFLFINGRFRILRRLAIPISLVIISLIMLSLIRKNDFQVLVFNNGVADCIYIKHPEANILIDTGPVFTSSYTLEKENDSSKIISESWMQRKGLQYFRRKGVSEIDWLILTHLHSDHAGGFLSLIKAMPVKNILISNFTAKQALWQKWMKGGYIQHSNIIIAQDTLSIPIGASRLKILHPDKTYIATNENDASLVVRMDHESQRYLFAADIEKEAEEHLWEHYPQELKADYYKAAHHGSNSSNTDSFIRAVSPKEVWITASHRNRFDFPHSDVIKVLDKYCQRIYLTADGTIAHSY